MVLHQGDGTFRISAAIVLKEVTARKCPGGHLRLRSRWLRASGKESPLRRPVRCGRLTGGFVEDGLFSGAAAQIVLPADLVHHSLHLFAILLVGKVGFGVATLIFGQQVREVLASYLPELRSRAQL